MPTWEAPGYDTIASAEATADGRVTVTFCDGRTVELDGVPYAHDGKNPHWAELTVEGDGEYILVPTDEMPFDIPWDGIRMATDQAFADHLAAVARREARRLGVRLRTLREQDGLTPEELAERAGVSTAEVGRVEAGEDGVVLTTLAKLLAALDCSWNDLDRRTGTGSRASKKRESRSRGAATTAGNSQAG